MATEEQTEMAFMQDDGMDVDPVSGNEIPPGSMASEVRDDIPAQLSEGEYVVPADVVRFFGVKFFEDLRAEAKMGLANMEANGRIGGEPVPVEGEVLLDYDDADLSDEEKAVLDEVTGMYGGGMARKKVYAADGIDLDPYTPQFTSGMGAMFAPGYLLDQTMGAPTVAPLTEVTLYGPNGETVKLTLPTDQAKYDSLIAQGYTTTPPAAVTVQPQVQAQGSDDSGPAPTQERKPWYEGVDWTTTDIAKPGAVESFITSVVPGVGTVVSMTNVAQQYAKANILEAAGDASAAKNLRDNIKKYIQGQGLATKIAADAFGNYADGDWYTRDYFESIGIEIPSGIKDDAMRDYIKQASKDPIIRKKIRTSIGREEPVVTTTPTTAATAKPKTSQPDRSPATAAKSLANLASSASDTNQLAAIQKAQKIAQKAADAGTSIAKQTQTGSKGYGSDSSADKPTGGQGSVAKGSGWGGMNKGGLMKKKQKK